MHFRSRFVVFALLAFPCSGQWDKIQTRSWIDEYCQKNKTGEYCRAYARGDKAGMAKAMTAGLTGAPVIKGVGPATKVASGTAVSAVPPASAQVLPEGSPLWRFAHPNAGMIFSMRLQALLNSPMVDGLWKVFGGMLPGGAGIESAKQELSGVELLMVSMRMAPGGKPDMLLLVRGDKPQSLVRGHTAPVRYLDPRTIVIGEWNAVHYAIQRVITPGPVTMKEQRVRDVAAWSDIWMSMDRSFLNVAPVFAIKPGVAVPAFTRATIGLTMREEMVTEAWIDTASVAAANKLLADLHTNPASVPALGELAASFAGDLKKEVKGTSVRLYARADARLFGEALVKRAPAAPEPPRRKTVVIQGMEGGTKEIPIVKQ
ncbi:MAG: hypothetical protein HY820_25645 [Acidobacteria bacterium]|nr:hypothetical protein [Acidobacteriota bacterium]